MEDLEDKLYRYKIEDLKREFEFLKLKQKLETQKSLIPLINHLFFNKQISDEDYMKWILCEDLDFIPKLIKND